MYYIPKLQQEGIDQTGKLFTFDSQQNLELSKTHELKTFSSVSNKECWDNCV